MPGATLNTQTCGNVDCNYSVEESVPRLHNKMNASTPDCLMCKECVRALAQFFLSNPDQVACPICATNSYSIAINWEDSSLIGIVGTAPMELQIARRAGQIVKDPMMGR